MRKLRVISSGSGGSGGSGAVNELKTQQVVALLTVADEDPATIAPLADTPLGNILVFVNGLEIEIGNGVKTKDAYFSDDGGANAKAFAAIAAGDILYWVGSVSGYQLAVSDKIKYAYGDS